MAYDVPLDPVHSSTHLQLLDACTTSTVVTTDCYWQVTVLKKELKKRGLDTSGKKADLVERLTAVKNTPCMLYSLFLTLAAATPPLRSVPPKSRPPPKQIDS